MRSSSSAGSLALITFCLAAPVPELGSSLLTSNLRLTRKTERFSLVLDVLPDLVADVEAVDDGHNQYCEDHGNAPTEWIAL